MRRNQFSSNCTQSAPRLLNGALSRRFRRLGRANLQCLTRPCRPRPMHTQVLFHSLERHHDKYLGPPFLSALASLCYVFDSVSFHRLERAYPEGDFEDFFVLLF